MANAFRSVLASGGGVVPTGNAQPADVLAGKTFSNADGIDKTGTMVNRGAVSGVATPSQPYTIPAGYHNGSGVVTGSGGSYDTSFVPQGQNLAIAGTNFTVGKYYYIACTGYNSGLTPVGCEIISILDESATYPNHAYGLFVKATASTITIGAAGSQACFAMPCEITL